MGVCVYSLISEQVASADQSMRPASVTTLCRQAECAR